MKIGRRIGICLLAAIITVTGMSNVSIVNAAENDNEDQVVISTEELKSGETISQTVVDSEGNEGVLEITEIPSTERASSRTWKVSYTAGIINCHFYMKVSNNKCISAYNKKIITIGCSYSNAKLKRTSTYARLSMDLSSLKGLANFNGWLQGKVTGKNNDIKVSYSF